MRHFCATILLTLVASPLSVADSSRVLTGRVLDETGTPVGGAKVVAMAHTVGLHENPEAFSAITADDGTFRFQESSPGVLVTVVATKEGKCFDWADWTDTDAGDLVLRLGAPAAIEGEVVDEGGKPVAAAVVSAVFRLGSPATKEMLWPISAEPFMTKTDGQGRFRFGSVPERATVAFDIAAPGKARALVDGHFAPGQKGLRFVLPAQRTINGTVVEKGTGQPLTDVSVWAVGSVSSGVHQAVGRTDKTGHFRIAGLSAGKYDIAINSGGKDPGQWFGSQEGVPVENGAVASAKIEAIRGGILEVFLSDSATGKPIGTAASIQVSPADDLRIRKFGFASKGGAARFCLAPGRYVVSGVSVSGYSCEREENKSFPVEAGKTEQAVVPAKAVPGVEVVVQDSSGKTVAGAMVQLLPLRGRAKALVADAKGRVTVGSADIGPLLCFLWIRHPGQNLAVLAAVSKDEKPPRVILRPPTTVSGIVQDANGRPVVGATVQAQIDASHFGRWAIVATVQTDAEGHYQMDLADTDAMGYAISARAAGYGVAEIVLSQVHIAEGQGKNHDFILKAANRVVRGTVKDTQGKPVAGVVITAKSIEGPEFAESAVTDEQGQFIFKQLTDDPVIYVFAGVPGRGWIGYDTIRPGDTDVAITVGPSHWD